VSTQTTIADNLILVITSADGKTPFQTDGESPEKLVSFAGVGLLGDFENYVFT
jgi:hypothetical protein